MSGRTSLFSRRFGSIPLLRWRPTRPGRRRRGALRLEPLESRRLLTAFGAGPLNNSEFMLGDVGVRLVLMESDGTQDPNTEDWTTDQIDQVIAEVTDGLQWWVDTLALSFSDRHHLAFHLDTTHAESPVPTGFEPITHPDTSQGFWITDYLDHIGANTEAPLFYDLDIANHQHRVDHGYDWATTIFVVNSLADPDGRFAANNQGGRAFAYAYLGGPFAVMTYDNNGWGINRMDIVTAHEVGHLFYALDEYPGSNHYNERSGYYATQNTNAADGHPHPTDRVISIMAESAKQQSAFPLNVTSTESAAMIGWQDGDGDGLFDVLDVPLVLEGTGQFDPDAATYTFLGTSEPGTLVNLNPRSPANDVTINRVDRLEYRIDDGPWTIAETFDSDGAVGLDLTLGPFGAGDYTLDLRTVDEATGITSLVFRDTFTSTAITSSFEPVAPDPRNAPLVSVALSFNMPVNGLDTTDFRLIRDGLEVPIGPGVAVESTDRSNWTLNGLVDLTGLEGGYELRLVAEGSGVTSDEGTALPIDATLNWDVDTTTPTANIPRLDPDPRIDAVTDLTITFDEAVTGFDPSDLRLERDGLDLGLDGATLNDLGDGASYRLTGLGSLTAEPGRYTLSLVADGSGIQDRAGNLVVEDARRGWLTDVAGIATYVKTLGQNGPNPDDGGQSVATDVHSNLYVTGSVFFAGDPTNAPGAADLVVVKYSAAGTLVWSHQLGGLGDDRGLDVAVDAEGFVHVVGYFGGTVDFDPDPNAEHLVTSAGGVDAFVARFDPDGRLDWVRTFGGDGPSLIDAAASVAIDPITGDVLVAGTFTGSTDFDPLNAGGERTSRGLNDLALARYDAQGTLVWVRTLGGFGLDGGSAVAVDDNGRIYLGGGFQGVVDVDPGPGSRILTSDFFGDALLLQFDAEGQLNWARAFGGSDIELIAGLAPLDDGVVVNGAFQGTLDLDGHGNAEVSSAGGADIFVARLDLNGANLWDQHVGDTQDQWPRASVVDPLGHVYQAGRFTGSVDFDPEVDDPDGNDILEASGPSDGFVWKLTPDGQFDWVRAIGGEGRDEVNGLIVDAQLRLGLTGSFEGTMTLDDGRDSWTVTSSGGLDLFAAKVLQPLPSAPTVTIAPVSPSLREAPVASIPITFNAPVSGFDLGDLALTLYGQPVDLSGATLNSDDQVTWTLGGLEPITDPRGRYELRLEAEGAGIVTQTGIALEQGDAIVWDHRIGLELQGASEAVRRFNYTLTLNVEAGGPADMPFDYRIDWGDGQGIWEFTGPSGTTLSYTYDQVGRFAIEVVATDPVGVESPTITADVEVAAAGNDPVGGQLQVGGSPSDDEIALILDGGSIRVTFEGESVGTFPIGGGLEVRAGDGDDRVTLPEFLGRGSLVRGEAGSDTLLGGAGDDTLEGGDGDDELLGSAGRDVLRGQAGDDTLDGGSGNDELTGGIGDDLARLTAPEVHAWLRVTRDGTTATLKLDRYPAFGGVLQERDRAQSVTRVLLQGNSGNDRLDWSGLPVADFEALGLTHLAAHGGRGRDILVGGPNAESLDGGEGNDNLSGNGGDDILSDLLGDNVLQGHDGDDTLMAGAGNDTLDGGEGDDDLDAGAGDDQVFAGAGLDAVQAGDGDDYLDGGEGDDTLDGGDGRDTIWAQAGEDLLLGGPGDDGLQGGSGNDRLEGQGGRDLLNGEEGADLLDGGMEADQAVGGDGDDTLIIGLGDDSLWGDDGRDTVVLRGTDDPDGLTATSFPNGVLQVERRAGDLDGPAVAVSLASTVEGLIVEGLGGDDVIDLSGLDPAIAVETIDGGAGDDLLRGSHSGTRIEGGPGADTLIGGLGDDTLDGGQGTDQVDLLGTDQDDVYALTIEDTGEGAVLRVVRRDDGGAVRETDDVRDADVVRLLAGEGHDDVRADTITPARLRDADIGALQIDGGLGDDTLWGSDARDSIDGGAGDDSLRGRKGNDRITGGPGNDSLVGQGGDDLLFGDEGDDTLVGNNHDDRLFGGPGDDLAQGGKGNDTLQGHDGRDTLSGQGTDDIIQGGPDGDLLQGGFGFDDLQGQAGNDTLEGGNKADTLWGGADDDLLLGGQGFDSLFGGGDDDTLHGEKGTDDLDGGPGADLFLADGRDQPHRHVIDLSPNGSIRIQRIRIAVDGSEVLSDLDRIVGFDALDAILMEALAGDDTIVIDAGVAIGGTVHGGSGFDTARIHASIRSLWTLNDIEEEDDPT